MNRSWLPKCENIADALAAIKAVASPEQRWRAARSLARHDHDFASTLRLDKALGRLRKEAADADLAGLQPVRLALLSTSTTGHLAAGLRVAGLGRDLLIDVYEPDYGQIQQELMDAGSGLHAFSPNAVIFAHDPYSIFGAGFYDDAEQAEQAVRAAVDVARSQWRRARELWGAVVIHQLPFNPFPRLLGENEHRLPGSPFAMIQQLQAALRAAADAEKIDLIDLDHWATRDGLAAWHSPALWRRSKQEVHPTIAPLYGDLAARVLAARFGRSAKCLVLDLDNTVWAGVIGDDGMDGIIIGQGSAVGEGHLAFQQYARHLARRGVILAVCSKNDDSVAREPFVSHPEMALKIDDISCFVANWTDKATNLRSIAKQLNIGLDALVFADDNPFERELVRAEIPEVFVPELGEEAADFAGIVADSGFFEMVAITAEDLAKTEQYRSNAKRQALLDDVTDLDSYLGALDMTLKHRPFDEVGLARIVQLINKTNQFNLTTRRYTEGEARKALGDPDMFTWQLRLVDKFGDNGIIGIVIARRDREADSLEIETWLMSCRVLGRQVEQATLQIVAEAAKNAGISTLIGEYVETARNGMVRDHYAKLGFSPLEQADGRTRWQLPVADYGIQQTHIRTESA